MEDRNELIKELFELHKLLADKGEVSIGYGFSENYKRLEDKVKKLTLTDVSQHRELLKAWDKWDENNCYKLRHLNLQQRIDVFMEAFNCG